MRPNETLFILDPPMTFTWTVNRPAPVSITSRFVRVAQENLSNWSNQRIFDGSAHILAKYERNATGESLNWIPASVIIPLNQTSNEANPIITLTYDSVTGRKSWIKPKEEEAPPWRNTTSCKRSMAGRRLCIGTSITSRLSCGSVA